MENPEGRMSAEVAGATYSERSCQSVGDIECERTQWLLAVRGIRIQTGVMSIHRKYSLGRYTREEPL